jgi:acyl carrier protein
MVNLIAKYQKKTGIKITDKQISKKLNNMKTDVKGVFG